jgi:hypothetical protein
MKTTQYPEKSIEQQIREMETFYKNDHDEVMRLVKKLFIALGVVIVGFSIWILFLIYG